MLMVSVRNVDSGRISTVPGYAPMAVVGDRIFCGDRPMYRVEGSALAAGPALVLWSPRPDATNLAELDSAVTYANPDDPDGPQVDAVAKMIATTWASQRR